MSRPLVQGWFHIVVLAGVPGQSLGWMVKFCRPSEILKEFSQSADAVFIWRITFSLNVCVELNAAVYVQSVATPTNATLFVDGHPELSPIVLLRLTPPLLPPVVVSICRLPKILEKSMEPYVFPPWVFEGSPNIPRCTGWSGFSLKSLKFSTSA